MSFYIRRPNAFLSKMQRGRIGALRYEDDASGLVWIVIVGKSMLLDTRQGKQLANDCTI